MHKSHCIFLLVALTIACTSSALAAPEELTINPQAIGEKRETWTSLTDLYNVDILTRQSAQTQEEVSSYLEQARKAKVSKLFSGQSVPQEDDPVLAFAVQRNLFLRNNDEVFIKPASAVAESTDDTAIYIIGGIVILLLGIISYYAASAWQKRKSQAVHSQA